MKRGFLVIAFLAVAMWAAAQTSGGGGHGSAGGATGGGAAPTGVSGNMGGVAGPVAPTPTVSGGSTIPGSTVPTPLPGVQPSFTPGVVPPGEATVPTGNEPVPTNNTSFGGGVAGGGLVTTPEVNLTTVMPTAGATNSTANLPAGASTNPAPVAPMPMATTVPVLENGAGRTLPPPSSQASASGVSLLGFNTGAANFDNVYASGSMESGESLGQIARQLREKKATENARLYTNQDIDRLNQNPVAMQSQENMMPNSSGGVAGQASAAANANVSHSRPVNPPANRVASPTTQQPPSAQPNQAQPQGNQPH